MARARGLFGWVALALGVLVLAGLVAVPLVNTDSGRSFLARQLARGAPESGLRIAVGRIDGSIYGRATLHDLTFSDPKGVFVRVPVATLDWRPYRLLQKQVDVRELNAPVVDWLRLPQLNKTDSKGPILPDIDIRIGKLSLGRIIIEAPVVGRRHEAALTGQVDIKSGRAMIEADAHGLRGGDRLTLKLDAEPDRDRFDIDARLTAPTPGVLTGLLGLKQPLAATLTGEGKWTNWRGRADATVGGKSLAALTITAQTGSFRVTGTAAPGLMSGGVLQRLATPNMAIDAKAVLGERRADLRMTLSSPQLRLGAVGGLDFAAGNFDKFAVDARVLRADALLRGAMIADARLNAKLSGPLARPVVEFIFTTPRLVVATTNLESLKLSGRADTGAGIMVVPVVATLGRIAGLGPDLQAILTNIRVSGPVTINALKLTSTRLALASDKLTGRGTLNYDLRTGLYGIGVLGDLVRYPLPGLGLVDVRADLRASPLPVTGQLHINGKAVAAVRQLDNGFFGSLMQGLPTITTDIDLPPGTGAVVFRDLRLASPGLRLSGSGDRQSDGTLHIAATGLSGRYGPTTLLIDGKLPVPRVDITLARPGFGIGLANVKGVLMPDGSGWTFAANGSTSYGPASASGRIGTQPVAIDIAALKIAGMTAQGTLRSAGEVLGGTLAVTGSGVTGSLRLSPANRIQRVDTDLKFERARLTALPPVSVAKGTLNATVLMNSDAPEITAKLVVAGARRASLTLTSADLDIDYKAGRGTAKGRIAGRQGAPFVFDGGVSFAPDLLTVTAAGTVGRQAVRLVNPAQLTRVSGGWRLAPVQLDLSGGTATIGGTFGDATTINAKLDGLGLGLVDLFYPGLGIGGSLSGTVDAVLPADGGLPRGRANLRVARFTRTGIAAVSLPVDLGINGAIDGGAAALKAVIVRSGVVVGRAQAQLKPIRGRADDIWLERLLAAPLTAQLRFNGQADALWPLLNIRAFDIKGPLAIAADFGGRLGEPTISGRMTSKGLRFESVVLGTTVENIVLDSRFVGPRVEFTSLSGTAGKGGTITGSGHIDLSLERGFPVDLRFEASNAQILRRDDLRATATGPIRITSDKDGGLIKGVLKVDKAEFRIGRPQLETVPELAVRERGDGIDATGPARKPTIWRMDVTADADNKIAVSGMGLDSEWSAKLRIGGRADAPEITGTANLVRGGYEFAGKRFELARGRLRFTGAWPPDPLVDIVAAANVQGVTATITIGGTGLRPEITFSSVPALPEDEVLSRVLFGSSITNLSAPEALQLAAAVASLRGGGGNFDVLGAVRKVLRIDRLRVLPGDTTTGRGTSVAAGRYIGDRVYVEVASDAQGYTATQIEISLTRSLSILSQVATVGGNSVNLKWSKDY